MIGILTPYGRSEVTAAAIRLADFALASGADVRLIGCGRREGRIHPFWDGRVSGQRGNGLYKAAKGCTQFVHFVCDKKILDMTRLVADKAKQILVPSWHQLRPGDLPTCKLFDYIVCPSKGLYTWFTGEVREINVARVSWNTSLPSMRREGLVESNKVRALFWCNRDVIDFCGPMILQLLGELLVSLPKLEIGLLSTKSWCRRDRAMLKTLERDHTKRFQRLHLDYLSSVTSLLHQYDWLAYPAVRSDFGVDVAQATACGVPVLAHDVCPLNEVVGDRHNGLLVNCDTRPGATKAPFAVPSFGHWLTACKRVFSNNALLLNAQGNNWKVEEAQQAFNLFWNKIWSA